MSLAYSVTAGVSDFMGITVTDSEDTLPEGAWHSSCRASKDLRAKWSVPKNMIFNFLGGDSLLQVEVDFVAPVSEVGNLGTSPSLSSPRPLARPAILGTGHGPETGVKIDGVQASWLGGQSAVLLAWDWRPGRRKLCNLWWPL